MARFYDKTIFFDLIIRAAFTSFLI